MMNNNSNNKKKFKFITKDKLKEFIINKQLIEIIFGDNFHVEVAKRSKPILIFLSNNNGLSNDYLSLLWKAC